MQDNACAGFVCIAHFWHDILQNSDLALVHFFCTVCHCADDTTRSAPEPTSDPCISFPNPVPGVHRNPDAVDFHLSHPLAIADVHSDPDAVGLHLPNALAVTDVVEICFAISDGLEDRFKVNHIFQDEFTIDNAFPFDN